MSRAISPRSAEPDGTGQHPKTRRPVYIRTRVRVIDEQTGKPRWKQIERKVDGELYRDAEAALKEPTGRASTTGRSGRTPTTVLELGQRWLRDHVQPNLKPSTAANYKGTFYVTSCRRSARTELIR